MQYRTFCFQRHPKDSKKARLILKSIIHQAIKHLKKTEQQAILNHQVNCILDKKLVLHMLSLLHKK